MIILCLLTKARKEFNGAIGECLQPNRKHQRGPKMRRVRNNINRSNNPAVLFASGLEGLVRDQQYNPSKYDEQEQRVMARKANKKEMPESFISILCSQLFWRKPGKLVWAYEQPDEAALFG